MIWPRENEFDPIVQKASDRYGVPFHIVKGMIGKESSFNPNAYKGEPQINDASRGLMQVLYGTAVWVGFPKTADVNDLYKPDVNIPLGVLTLRRFMDMVTKANPAGTWEDAISIYNAGATKGKPGVPRRDAAGKYVNQAYVNDVKVYAGYFQKQIPEPTVKQYQRTKVLSFAVPALGIALAIAAGIALMVLRARPSL